jgi:hypothetical protein
VFEDLYVNLLNLCGPNCSHTQHASLTHTGTLDLGPSAITSDPMKVELNDNADYDAWP